MTREEFIAREIRLWERGQVFEWFLNRAAILLALMLIASLASAGTQHKVTYSVSLYKGTTKTRDIAGISIANAQANCEAELAKQTTAATYSCKTPVATDVVIVVPDPPPQPAVVLQFTATYGTAYKALQGETVSGKVNIALSDCSVTGSWVFYLDGIAANNEGGCPYEFLGDALMWDSASVPDGTHTIEVRGTKSITATFTTSNKVTAPPPATGSASLTWVPPTQNTDGSALTDLAGYFVRYGTSASSLTQTITLPSPGMTAYIVQGLTVGTYYFSIEAVNAAGVHSNPSGIVSKTL